MAYDGRKADDLRGKIFAFSLEVYEKCVFVSPDTIMLENCDNWFENTNFPGTQFNGESDAMFVFSPKWAVCQFLKEKFEQSIYNATNGFWNNFIMKSVQAQMKNDESGDLCEVNADLSATKFSMKTGGLVGAGSCTGLPKVVQFVDADLGNMEFAVRMKKFSEESKNVELLEQVYG